jgi:signal peptidase II
MLRRIEWLLYVGLPFIAVMAMDQWSKSAALQWVGAESFFGPLLFKLLENHGFFLGSLKDFPPALTVMIPATAGGFVVYLLVLFQYFLPLRSPWMRVGLSIFVAGVVSNTIDRVRLGYVVDFVQIRTEIFKSGVFNLADVLQWVGVVIFLVSYVRHGRLLYRTDERRTRKWIDPTFQLRYCGQLIGVGVCFAVLSGFISAGFLQVLARELSPFDLSKTESMIRVYLLLYGAAALTFFITLAVVGIQLSHRIIGPVRGFEFFLNDLMQGKYRALKLRDRDEFLHLEKTSEKFLDLFMNVLKINPEQLAQGQFAGPWQATTHDGKLINPSVIEGRRCWLILYRYAGCPLCADHLESFSSLMMRAQAAGVFVAAVYDSTSETFADPAAGRTAELQRMTQIPLIADPEQRLYRRFRAQVRRSALLHPASMVGLVRALGKGFRQSKITGEIGRLPMHVFLEANGAITAIHYGKHLADHPGIEWIEEKLRLTSA